MAPKITGQPQLSFTLEEAANSALAEALHKDALAQHSNDQHPWSASSASPSSDNPFPPFPMGQIIGNALSSGNYRTMASVARSQGRAQQAAYNLKANNLEEEARLTPAWPPSTCPA